MQPERKKEPSTLIKKKTKTVAVALLYRRKACIHDDRKGEPMS